jgi:molecular chaperone IbpA
MFSLPSNMVWKASGHLDGLDSIFKEVDKVFEEVGQVKSHRNYPPYNISTNGDTGVVEVAVAGFTKSELTVKTDDGFMFISGKKDHGPDYVEPNYSHKGISTRSFTLRLQLGKYFVVDSTELKDGILTVNMKKVVPDEKKEKIFEIA